MRYLSVLVVFLLLGSCTKFSEEAAYRFVEAEMLMEHRPDSALRILQRVAYPEQLQEGQYAAYCLLYTTAWEKTENPFTSDSLIKNAVDYFSRHARKYPRQAVLSEYYLGRVYQETGRGEEAMQLYLEVESKVEALNDNNLTGLLNNYMGYLFRKQNVIDQSIPRYKRAVSCFKKTNKLKNEGYAFADLGYDYLYLKQYDSAVVYLQQAKGIANTLADTALLSQSLMSLGMAYSFLDRPEAVKMYLQEAINYEKDERLLVQSYNYLADAYIKEHQYELGRFYAQYALKISEKQNNVYGVCNGNWYLYNIEKAENRLKEALVYYQGYSRAKDTIAALETRNNIFAVQEKYRTEELRAENMSLLARQRYDQLAIIVIILLVVLVVTLSFLAYSRHRQKMLYHKNRAMSKEHRLKEFLLKRLDVSKEVIALAQHSTLAPDKVQAKLRTLVEAHSFNLNDQKVLIDMVNELYDNFAVKLQAAYPQLSPDEVQLCCMVRSGFDTGLIATIMGLNFESVYKKRSRLRQKIQLEKDTDFERFLQKF